MKIWDKKTPIALLVAVIAIVVGISVTIPPSSIKQNTTFEGRLPCADCPGIIEELTLFKSGDYLLKDTYLERDSPFEDKGTWTIEDNILKLTSSSGGIRYFSFTEDKLGMLDSNQKKIDSPFNQTLTKK